MPIADYLNKYGNFVLVRQPAMLYKIRTARGHFLILPPGKCKSVRDIRSRYKTLVCSTAFSIKLVDSLYYIPHDNCAALEEGTRGVRRAWIKLSNSVKKSWGALTKEALAGMLDLLTVQWQCRPERDSLTQVEYLAPSKKGFLEFVDRGPLITAPGYTYSGLLSGSRSEPQYSSYTKLEAELYRWLQEVDAACLKLITKKLQWLVDRVRAYLAISDGLYVRRLWFRDSTVVPLGRYAVWMHILGRDPAAQILRRVYRRLAKFYEEHKGTNKEDGSGSSRSDAVKIFATIKQDLRKFLDSYTKPLNVDALAGAA